MITPTTGAGAGSPAPPVIAPIDEDEQDITPGMILPGPEDEPVETTEDTTEID